MPPLLTRRHFLQTTTLAAGAAALPLRAAEAKGDFSFILLGDLHFDRLAHHDMGWLDKNKKGDLSQIQNYSRITADIMPRLFETVRETVKSLAASGDAPPAFVLQVGDIVEGLC